MEQIRDYLQEPEREAVPMLVEDQDSGSDLTQSDPESDCESETDEWDDTNPFALFTRNGMMCRINDLSSEYARIVKLFAIGMGTAAGVTEIVAAHKNSFSGLSGSSRIRNFRRVLEEMKKKHGEENMNIRYTWYAAEKLEIADIVSRGFTSFHDADDYGRIGLIPVKRALDGAMGVEAEEDGLRHMLLCRVILGKLEEITPDSIQEAPSSDEFDTGVDSIVNCRKYFVWRPFMNSHIVPAYIVSFKGPENLRGNVTTGTTSTKAVGVADPITQIKRAGPFGRVTLPGLMIGLSRFLIPREMKIIFRLLEDFRAKRINGEELKRQVKLIAGDKLVSAMKLMSSSVKMENGSVRDIYLPGLINVLAATLPSPKTAMLTKSLKEFRANKMNRQELARTVRVIVGDDNVLASAISSYRIGKQRQQGKLIV